MARPYVHRSRCSRDTDRRWLAFRVQVICRRDGLNGHLEAQPDASDRPCRGCRRLALPERSERLRRVWQSAWTGRNVTAVKVSCQDARIFARKVAQRHPTRSQWIALPGWREYYARVRRAGGKYDVRATRGDKVIRFQYASGESGGGGCDPNYAGACLDPTSPDYDCAGGSGDGPDYTGRVDVVGDDHFDLDRDGDGVGCD